MVLPVPPNPSYVNADQFDRTAAINNSALPEELRFGSGFVRRNEPTQNVAGNRNESSDEGLSLYRGFLADQFRRQNLPEPAELLNRDSAYHRVPESSSSDIIRAGHELRRLTEEFSNSPMRQWVQDEAARAPLEELDFNAFSDLLYGLFQEGGVTWERVVILFHFCTDLAARAFRERLPHQLHNIVEWSFRFFAGNQMLQWIARHGGWANVLQQSMDRALKVVSFGFLLIGAIVVTSYFAKYVRKPIKTLPALLA